VKLYVDLNLEEFVSGPGLNARPRGVKWKRNDAGSVVIQFCRGGTLVDLGAGAAVVFSVKESGKYDMDPLIHADNFTPPAVSGEEYVASPTFDTVAIDAALNVDADLENDVAELASMCEVSWKVSGKGWLSTGTQAMEIQNDVIRDDDELPELILGGVPGVKATVSIEFSDAVEVINQSGYLDIDGWRVNLYNTAGTGTPGSGDLLSFDDVPGEGWIDVIRALAEVINTGAVVETGFTLTGTPGSHSTVDASVIDNVGAESEPVYLVLTAKTAGAAGNAIAYDFNDSEDVEDDSGTLAGGVDARALELGDLVPTYEPAVALTDAQQDQAVENLNLSVVRDNVRCVDVAHAGYVWRENDVALSFFGGQSNCSGEYGTAPADPLANVFVMKRQTSVFAAYDDADNNVYSTAKAGKAGALQEMARYWQARVDAGDEIPDLYAVAVSTGSAGFEADGTGAGDREWAHDLLDYTGTAFGENLSLWKMWMDSVRSAVEEIRKMGKNPVLMSITWIQGEEDARQELYSREYARNLFEFYRATSSILGREDLPFYMVEVLSSTYFPYNARINNAFQKLADTYSSAVFIRWDDFADYDQTDSQLGIYGGDGIHYDADAQAYLSERVYDRLSVEESEPGEIFGKETDLDVSMMRQIPLNDISFVTVGSVTANASTFDSKMSYVIRTDGQLSSNEGGFWKLPGCFSAKGSSSTAPNTSKWPFRLQLDCWGLPENNSTVRIACGAPNDTAFMAIDGTDSGLVFEVKATGVSTFEIRAGVARAGTMTWSGVKTLTAGQYTDEYSYLIDARNGVARFALIKNHYGAWKSVFYHRSTIAAPDGTTDANLSNGGKVQIVTTVHTGSAVEISGTFTALKVR
jgi:hypothetical protein